MKNRQKSEKKNLQKIAAVLLLCFLVAAGTMPVPALADTKAKAPSWGFDNEYASGMNVEENEDYEEHGWSLDFSFEVPDGKTLEDYIKFTLTYANGDPADDYFSVAAHPDYDYMEINVAPGLEVSDEPYTCIVNMFYDSAGEGHFGNTPYKHGNFSIAISRPEYAIGVSDLDLGVLHEGYSQSQTVSKDLVITNKGTENLTFGTGCLTWDSDNAGPFIITLQATFPLTLSPGQSQRIATIKPSTGSSVGRYDLDLNITDISNHVALSVTADYVVARMQPGPALEAEGGPIDFGILPEGSSESPRSEWIYLYNQGDTALSITDTAVSNELFTCSPEMVDDVIMPGGEVIYSVSLDPDSLEAAQTGTYSASITFTATEMTQSGGTWIQGSRTAEALINAGVRISDKKFTITIDKQGAGDTVSIPNVPEGSSVREVTDQWLRDNYPDDPVLEGKVFLGIYLKPISWYRSWTDMDENASYGSYTLDEMILSKDETVYFAWADSIPEVDIQIRPPVPNMTAGTPDIRLRTEHITIDGTPYWAYENDSGSLKQFKGTFVDGSTYYAMLVVKPEFPYAFGENCPATVNGVAAESDHYRNIYVFATPLVAHVHETERYQGHSPTCTEPGNIAYWRCRTCGKYFSDQEYLTEIEENSWIIPAAGHSPVRTEAADPTCTKDGNIEGWTCSACGKHFDSETCDTEIPKSDWIIPATGHSPVKVDAAEPTCTEEGHVEGWTCSVCGKHFDSETCETEIPESSWIIPAGGHNAGDPEVTAKATLSKNGTIVTRCTVCGDIVSAKEIPHPGTIKLSAAAYVWNGKVKKPAVTVKDAEGRDIDEENYSINYAKGRKNVGKYTVRVSFKGDYYSGTKTMTFKINPKMTSLRTVTSPAKKKIRVTWYKRAEKMSAARITGYQVKIAGNKAFTKEVKTFRVKGYKNTYKVARVGKSKKRYYAKVRTYRIVNGVTYWSKWSGVKSRVVK
ncbi:MAG: hypothetical protein IKE49_00045 [Firmicutes bacterium]|nr:hypothetical protein [Bacillota bacterium]